MEKFVVGAVYEGVILRTGAIRQFEVVKRTPKYITIKGEMVPGTERVKVQEVEGVETAQYSCAWLHYTIRADKAVSMPEIKEEPKMVAMTTSTVVAEIKMASTLDEVKSVLKYCTKPQLHEVFIAVTGLEKELAPKSWKKEMIVSYYSAQITAYKAREAFMSMTAETKAEYLKGCTCDRDNNRLEDLLRLCSMYELLVINACLGGTYEEYKAHRSHYHFVNPVLVLRESIYTRMSWIRMIANSKQRKAERESKEPSESSSSSTFKEVARAYLEEHVEVEVSEADGEANMKEDALAYAQEHAEREEKLSLLAQAEYEASAQAIEIIEAEKIAQPAPVVEVQEAIPSSDWETKTFNLGEYYGLYTNFSDGNGNSGSFIFSVYQVINRTDFYVTMRNVCRKHVTVRRRIYVDDDDREYISGFSGGVPYTICVDEAITLEEAVKHLAPLRYIYLPEEDRYIYSTNRLEQLHEEIVTLNDEPYDDDATAYVPDYEANEAVLQDTSEQEYSSVSNSSEHSEDIVSQSATEARAEKDQPASSREMTLEEEWRAEAKIWRELAEERTTELLSSYTAEQIVYALNIFNEAMTPISYRPIHDIVWDYLDNRDDAMNNLEDIAMMLKIKPYEYEEDKDYLLWYDIGDYYGEILLQTTEIIALLGKSSRALEIEREYKESQRREVEAAKRVASEYISNGGTGLVEIRVDDMSSIYREHKTRNGDVILQAIAKHNYEILSKCETKAEVQSLVDKATALTLSLTVFHTRGKQIDYRNDERTREQFMKMYLVERPELVKTVVTASDNNPSLSNQPKDAQDTTLAAYEALKKAESRRDIEAIVTSLSPKELHKLRRLEGLQVPRESRKNDVSYREAVSYALNRKLTKINSYEEDAGFGMKRTELVLAWLTMRDEYDHAEYERKMKEIRSRMDTARSDAECESIYESEYLPLYEELKKQQEKKKSEYTKTWLAEYDEATERRRIA